MLEMLVALAAIGTLLVLLAPMLLSSRGDSHRIQCSDNLRRLGAGFSEHVAKHRFFPPSHSNHGRTDDSSWTTRLLPYLDEQAAFERYQFKLPWSHLANAQIKNWNLNVQLCPASAHQDAGQGDYGGLYGPHDLPGSKRGWQKGRTYAAGILIAVGGDTDNQPIRLADVTDGLGKTLTVAEDAGRTDESRFWADPYQAFVQEGPINLIRSDEIFSDHPGGAFVLFGDGHTHFLPETTNIAVINALATRAGGEIIPKPYLTESD
jgi:hypothetical protein